MEFLNKQVINQDTAGLTKSLAWHLSPQCHLFKRVFRKITGITELSIF